MTKKEYIKICRSKVERYTENLTCITVCTILTLGYIIPISGYLVAVASTIVWFKMPALVKFALENYYKLKHIDVRWK